MLEFRVREHKGRGLSKYKWDIKKRGEWGQGGAADILSWGGGPLHRIVTDQSGSAWHGTVSIKILSSAWETHCAAVLVVNTVCAIR